MITLTLSLTLLTLLILAACFLLVHWSLIILDRLRQLAAAAGLDLVQFYAAWSQAHLDTKERDSKIEAAIDTAAAELHHRVQIDRIKHDGLTLDLGQKAHKLRLTRREGVKQ